MAKKLPLNYAIIKYFTTVDEACADDVIAALQADYGNYKAFKKNQVVEALMTLNSNGVIEESGFDEDENGDLRVYYHTTPDSLEVINKYIPD
ncbi:MAG: hypothetical protein SOV71_06335 [Anaerovoracaceae bacterium]|jgi:DNA-binding PadR family transcriptional regulator|nr:hypothetical protein [Anaerovoracaceae bacterium]